MGKDYINQLLKWWSTFSPPQAKGTVPSLSADWIWTVILILHPERAWWATHGGRRGATQPQPSTGYQYPSMEGEKKKKKVLKKCESF